MEKGKEKKCSSCGELMGAEDAFCRNCGSRFTEKTGLGKCSACGKPMEPGAVFCTNCGNRSEKEMQVILEEHPCSDHSLQHWPTNSLRSVR